MPSSFLSVYAQEDKLNRQLLTSFEEARLEMATRRSGRRRQQNAEGRLRVTRAAAAIERAINSGDMRLPHRLGRAADGDARQPPGIPPRARR